MRLIGSVKSEEQLKQLSFLFQKKGIEHSYEYCPSDEKHQRFDIWVVNEDRIDQAEQIFQQFISSGGNAFSAEIQKEEKKQERAIFETPPISPKTDSQRTRYFRSALITNLLIALCSLFFVVEQVQLSQIKTTEARSPYKMQVITPLMQWMLFDYPKAYDLIQQYQNTFAETPFQPDGNLSSEQRQLRNEILNTPTWTGLYPLLVLQFQGKADPADYLGPKCEKILEGQIWRIFTPIFLHASLLHLLFNMLWLFVLGTPIERRVGKIKYLSIVLFAAAVCNIGQYIMTGPLFLGFSGVICAFAGFVFSRKKLAPWEGYPVQKSVLWFLFTYISVFFGIQIFVFTLSTLGYNMGYAFLINIANTAHVAGALFGLLIGRFSFYSWRAK